MKGLDRWLWKGDSSPTIYLIWLEFLNDTTSLDSKAKEFINTYIQQPLRNTLVHLRLFFSQAIL